LCTRPLKARKVMTGHRTRAQSDESGVSSASSRALQPQRCWVREQPDGDEFDMDALIRNRCDVQATGNGSERIYQSLLSQSRDLAVSLLVDTSLSTESWLEDRRVLDVGEGSTAGALPWPGRLWG